MKRMLVGPVLVLVTGCAGPIERVKQDLKQELMQQVSQEVKQQVSQEVKQLLDPVTADVSKLGNQVEQIMSVVPGIESSLQAAPSSGAKGDESLLGSMTDIAQGTVEGILPGKAGGEGSSPAERAEAAAKRAENAAAKVEDCLRRCPAEAK